MNGQAQPRGSYDSSGQWQPGFHDAQGTWHGGFYDGHGQWQPGFYGSGNQWHGGFYDHAGAWHAGYRSPDGSWTAQQAPAPAAPPAEVPLPAGAVNTGAQQPISEQPTQVVPQLSQDAGAYVPPPAEQPAEDELKGKGGACALVAFLLVLLGGAAAAGWWYFLREDEEEPDQAAAEEAAEETSAEPAEEPVDEPREEDTDREEEDPAEEETQDEPSFDRNPEDMEITSAQTFSIPDAAIGSETAPVTYTVNRAKLTENHQNDWNLWGLEPNGAAPEGQVWLVVDMSISMPQNQNVSFNGGTWTLTATDQNGVSGEHAYNSAAGEIGEWPAGDYGALILIPEDAEEVELEAELQIFYGGSGTTTVTSTEPITLDFPLAD